MPSPNAGARVAPITNEVATTTGRDAKQILAGRGPRHPNKPNAPTTVADGMAGASRSRDGSDRPVDFARVIEIVALR